MSGGSRTHRPEHNPQTCMACGGCTWNCPASVFPSLRREEDSLRGELYSTRQYNGEKADKPPCTMACPLGQDVPGYISAIAAERFDEAARIIRRTNALPSVCGRLCVASCMRACTRNGIDRGVDIRGLKRFAVQTARMNPAAPVDQKEPYKVAVVGAGPAGLAAAHFLVTNGVKAVVHDAKDVPGGAIHDTVPAFAISKKLLAQDVEDLVAMGVEFKTGVRVGKDLSWEDIQARFDAVLVTTGARRGMVPVMKGSHLKNVVQAPSFNREGPPVEGAVVVVGGGAAALQSARAALRLGADKVTVIHPSPKEQWSAGERELLLAAQEGVTIRDLIRVESLLGEGSVTAANVKNVRALNPDKVDRHTLKSAGKAEQVPCDLVIFATERRPDSGASPDLKGIRKGVLGNLVVDDYYRLGPKGWYAAGEIATGAATIVDSMGTGRRAAESILEDLRQGGVK